MKLKLGNNIRKIVNMKTLETFFKYTILTVLVLLLSYMVYISLTKNIDFNL